MCQLQSAHSLYTHDAQYNPVMWPWEHLQVRKNLPIRAILLSRRFKVQHKPHWGVLFLHHGGWRGGVGGILPQRCLSVCKQWEIHECSDSPQTLESRYNFWRYRTGMRWQNVEHQVKPDHLNFAMLMSTIMIYLSVAFVFLLKEVLEYKDLIYGWLWFTTTTE